MAAKATVTLYRVRSCGLFKYPQSRKAEFGDMAAILSDLAEWADGQYLEDTKVFDPDENSDMFPVYLADIAQMDGDWLIALWNQMPESEGGVAAISARSPVGQPSVKVAPSVKGTLPGIATYFWFLPDAGLLATVKIQRPFTGQSALQAYIENYIRYFSSYVVHDVSTENTDDVSPLGYRQRPQDEPMELHAKFRTRLCRLPSEVDELVANAANITKICRRDYIDLSTSVEKKRWESVAEFIGIASPSVPTRKRARLEYVADISMDAQQVKEIVEDWNKSGGPEGATDIGFHRVGQSGFTWLSGSVARDEIDVDLQNKVPEFFDAAVLLRSLRKHRTRLVTMVSN